MFQKERLVTDGISIYIWGHYKYAELPTPSEKKEEYFCKKRGVCKKKEEFCNINRTDYQEYQNKLT